MLNDLALAAGALEIIVHVAEAGVGHGLDAVEVLLPGLLQVVGRGVFRDASLQTRLRDVGIHVIKLGLRHVNVYTTEHVNGVRDGLPVEGDVVLDVQVQVFVQGGDGLLGAAVGVGFVDFCVAGALAEVKVGVAVDGHEGHVAGRHVGVRNDLNVGV